MKETVEKMRAEYDEKYEALNAKMAMILRHIEHQNSNVQVPGSSITLGDLKILFLVMKFHPWQSLSCLREVISWRQIVSNRRDDVVKAIVLESTYAKRETKSLLSLKERILRLWSKCIIPSRISNNVLSLVVYPFFVCLWTC